MTTEQGSRSAWLTWWVAVRPFAYTGSVLPVVVGTVLAWHAGFPFRLGAFALALLGVVCFHTAANLLNDYFDYRRGLDTVVNPGSGALVRGWLTDRQVFRAACLCFAVGTCCGLALVWQAGWPVLWLGLAGGLLVAGYTRSGFCLKYAGLGDAAIFLAFGPLPVVGAYWVQALAVSADPLLWSVPVVLPTVGILHANNWRDMATDPGYRCRTLASRLGPLGSRVYYQLLILMPFVLTGGYVLLGTAGVLPIHAPVTALLALLSFPVAIRLAGGAGKPVPAEFAMLDARTARMHGLFNLLLVSGFVLDRILAAIR